MNEAQFQRNVVDLARMCGWLIHHDRGDYRDCIAGDPGFPDLVLARRGVVLFAELKSEQGELSAAQRGWMHELDPERGYWSAQSTHLWRPSDIDAAAKILAPRNR